MFLILVLTLTFSFHYPQFVDEQHANINTSENNAYLDEHRKAKEHLSKAGQEIKEGAKDIYDSAKHEAKAWKNKVYPKKGSYGEQNVDYESETNDNPNTPRHENQYASYFKENVDHVINDEDRFENLKEKANKVTQHVKEDGSSIAKKGEQLYDSIGNKVNDKLKQAGENLKENYQGMKNKAGDFIDEAEGQLQENSEEIYEKGKEYGEDIKEKFKEKKSKLSEKTKKFINGEKENLAKIRNKVRETSRKQRRRIKLKTIDYLKRVFGFFRSSTYFIGDRIDDMVGPVFVPVTSIYYGLVLLYYSYIYRQGVNYARNNLQESQPTSIPVNQDILTVLLILSMLVLELNNFSQLILNFLGMAVLTNIYLSTLETVQEYNDLRHNIFVVCLSLTSAFSILAGVKGMFFEEEQ